MHYLHIAVGAAVGAALRYLISGWTYALFGTGFPWGTLVVNLAGATVRRGMMGFGAASRVHTAQLLRMSDDLPLVIEIVDSEDYIQRLLPFLDEAIVDGIVTMEKVRILHYHSRSEKR